MERCKHEQNIETLVCDLCGWTNEQINNEWYEFVKDLQTKYDEAFALIHHLTERLEVLENK
jgi:hypothetical protein